MLDRTKALHDQMVRLGQNLGFVASREVSNSVLSLQLDEAYQPRVDLMWSQELTQGQSSALGDLLRVKPEKLSHLPLVGIEVEGTAPSTKTLEADYANIAALGTKYGLLVVSEEGERGIYGRAARIIRTLRRNFGHHAIVPMEGAWLEQLLRVNCDSSLHKLEGNTKKKGSGGELGWSPKTREYLAQVGLEAGFTVVHDYTPPLLGDHFEWIQKSMPGANGHMTAPASGRSRSLKKATEYFTGSKLDVAWLLPLPRGLAQLLTALGEQDLNLVTHGLLIPGSHDHVVVAGFELESSSGKHAAGGLLNLSAYSVIGFVVSNTEQNRKSMVETLKRYQPTLGLRNVHVIQIR